jgi:hypothetical protein
MTGGIRWATCAVFGCTWRVYVWVPSKLMNVVGSNVLLGVSEDGYETSMGAPACVDDFGNAVVVRPLS